ncbi:hypothetical protein B9M91_17510 [Escherichia coli]|nr:hypothetical protein B9M91_17510 [Escherichia coli]
MELLNCKIILTLRTSRGAYVAPEYADIRQVESSTAVLYLFSERFMTYGKAYGLCEWFEVEQFQNP